MNTVPYPGRPLRRGSTGKDGLLVQKAVGAQSDGIFGLRMEATVKAFQLGRALVPDGIVGPKTWNLLF